MSKRLAHLKSGIVFEFGSRNLAVLTSNYFPIRFTRFSAGAILAISISIMWPVLATGNLLFKSGFESGNFSGWGGNATNNGPSVGTASIVTSPRRAGNRAACFDLRRDPVNAPKRRRSELRVRLRPQYGKDYWYGWSRYIPSNWVFDNKVSSVMAQWHLNNATVDAHAANRPSNIGVPVLFIGNGTTMRIKLNAPNGQKVLYQSPYTQMKGKWTDYVMHAKWSPKSDGILEIWQNGQKIVNYRGATSAFDRTGGPYFLVGIYKPEWNPRTGPGRSGDTNQVKICYDEVSVGGPSASFRDVAVHGVAKTVSASGSVQKATLAATKKPVAKKNRKKPVAKKNKKIKLKACNKLNGKKRKRCRRRVKR